VAAAAELAAASTGEHANRDSADPTACQQLRNGALSQISLSLWPGFSRQTRILGKMSPKTGKSVAFAHFDHSSADTGKTWGGSLWLFQNGFSILTIVLSNL
jgi:hypothetical protein